jgi:hypothetical protein
MLHIITPLFRYQYLGKIYDTIPQANDITWHLIKSAHREEIPNIANWNKCNVVVHTVPCSDNDIISKRNAVFETLIDGYFYLLDDDTVFLHELYEVYKQYAALQFVGMIIGAQRYGPWFFSNQPNFPTANLANNYINTGMVVAHCSVLQHVKYASIKGIPIDSYFWGRCYLYFGDSATILLKTKIAYFNYFSYKIRIDRFIIGERIIIKIYNPILCSIIKFISFLWRLIFEKNRVNYTALNNQSIK